MKIIENEIDFDPEISGPQKAKLKGKLNAKVRRHRSNFKTAASKLEPA